MQRALISVIGPAPSELGEEYRSRLSQERKRIGNALFEFRENLLKKKKPKKKAKKTKNTGKKRLGTILKNAGVTLEQLEAAAKVLDIKEEKNEGKN